MGDNGTTLPKAGENYPGVGTIATVIPIGGADSGAFGIKVEEETTESPAEFRIVEVESPEPDCIVIKEEENSAFYNISFTEKAVVGKTYYITYTEEDVTYKFPIKCGLPRVAAYKSDTFNQENLILGTELSYDDLGEENEGKKTIYFAANPEMFGDVNDITIDTTDLTNISVKKIPNSDSSKNTIKVYLEVEVSADIISEDFDVIVQRIEEEQVSKEPEPYSETFSISRNVSQKVKLNAYETLNGDSEPLTVINDLEEFYVIADYNIQEKGFYFCSDNEADGIFITPDTGIKDGKPYAKIVAEGYFYNKNIRITFWIDGEEPEAGDIELTINKEYVPADKSLIVCTSPDDGNTFEPIPVRVDPSKGAESPAQYVMPKDKVGVFYVLCQGNGGKELTLPILDCYREPTGKVASDLQIEKKGTTKKTYGKEYSYDVWKVTVPAKWSGAERVGFSFGQDDKGNPIIEKYSLDGNESQQTKFMWIAGSEYIEEINANYETKIIPFEEDIINIKKFENEDELFGSDYILGTSGEWLTKNVNMSLEPEENYFYLLHPQGTELNVETWQRESYEIGGYGIGGNPLGGNLFKNIETKALSDSKLYKCETVKDEKGNEISINVSYNDGEKTMSVSKISLKKYATQKEVYSKFTIKDSPEYQNEFATVRLCQGMNISIQCTGLNNTLDDTDANDIAHIMDTISYSQKAMGIEDSNGMEFGTPPVEGKFSSYYADAYAIVSDEGQGKMTFLNIDLEPGYVIEKITNHDGTELEYVGVESMYLELFDSQNNSITDGEEIWNKGWHGRTDGNTDKNGNDIQFITAYHCFAASGNSFMHYKLNEENVGDILKFLEKNDFSVKQKTDWFTAYTVYFTEDIAEQTELIFHIKKAQASEDEISVSGNDENKVNAALSETETTATKDLLKKNLTTIGTDGYEVLDVYDITAGEADVKGLYNITIPAPKLKNANPKECKVVYYADDGNAVPLEMETTYTMDANKNATGIVFTTGHFSKYAVITKAKSSGGSTGGGGGGGFIPPVTDNDNVTKKAENTLPEKTVQELSEKTEAQITIKTDAAEVTLDKAAVDALAAQAGTTGTVKLIVETVKQDENTLQVELKLVTSKGVVSDFKGGNVSVTINLGKALAAKNVVCVYIDDNGTYHKVNGTKNPDGTYTFTTGHFSTYAVIAETEAEEIFAQQKADADKLVTNLKLKARSSKTAKGNIKVNLTVTKGSVRALEDLGYTVKYKYYRSTSKAKGYKAKYETKGKMYINTAAKKGTRYYYKARVMVYDANGNLVTKSELKQCRYASRVK